MGPAAPYLALAWLLSLIGIAALVGVKVHHADQAACQVEKDQMVVESNKRKETEAAKATKAATKLEVKDDAARTLLLDLTKKVDTIVERPDYQRECFDADGVSSINSAITGAGAVAPQPPATVPAHPTP